MKNRNYSIPVATIVTVAFTMTVCDRPEADFRDGLSESCRLVNKFIGTGGYVKAYPGDSVRFETLHGAEAIYPFGGLTFPGAVVPFGMIQLSPDCNDDGFGWSAGYHYSDSSIAGFSMMHTSGNGRGFGHFLFMPGTGHVSFEAGPPNEPDAGYRSRFNHENEEAFPGYYSVMLKDEGIRVELTAAEHAGMQRYTYPGHAEPHVILDLRHGLGSWRNPRMAGFVQLNDSTILCNRLTENGIESFMAAVFSRKVKRIEIQENGLRKNYKGPVDAPSLVACLYFSPSPIPLEVKCGISFTSGTDALNNLITETGNSGFDQIAMCAVEKWNKIMDVISVEGGTLDERIIFNTALYHCSLTPFLFNNCDGSFRGADGRKHLANGFVNYTFFTLWDTYRTLHPLHTITQPCRVSDYIHSMLEQARLDSSHLLPLWCLAGRNGYNMAGYSAAPVIAEAVSKNFTGFDRRWAYELLVENAMHGGFAGHEAYMQLGYVPADQVKMSVPRTLEYAFCDWNIALLGRMTGARGSEEFLAASSHYRNLFDATTGFMRPRLSDGSWRTPFDPKAVSHQFQGDDYMESNAWQYTWHVMHDVPGLIALMGGPGRFCEMLDSLFDQETVLTGTYAADVSGLIGQYAQGNQPDHHVAYLYMYAGKPWKTQERIRQIREKTYANSPDGLPGNDDGGEMSAWYIFGALGFYPVNPAEARYVLGVPLFKKAVIRLPHEKTFEIRAKGISKKNGYVQSVFLNGKPHTSIFIRHDVIMQGGILEFNMGNKPVNAFKN